VPISYAAAHRTLRILTFVMLNRRPRWPLSPAITEAVGAAMRRVPLCAPKDSDDATAAAWPRYGVTATATAGMRHGR
jgi:hypothetical protein